MANIKSAKKRISTNDRQRAENRYIKATISTYIKNYQKALASGNLEDAKAQLTTTISYIDSACSKGVLHRNNASRKIARLTKAFDKANLTVPKKQTVKKVEKVEVKEATVEEAPKKAPAKKTATKTTAKKETAEKKTTAKKTTKKETK